MNPLEAITLREMVQEEFRRRFGRSSFAYSKIVLTGFVQVFLVSVQTFNIAHGHALAAAFFGFAISIVWSLNVRSIVLGGWPERLLYSGAAASGTVLGMFVPQLLYSVTT
jgi:hypothetical protein